jgi:hypothetical protein
MASKKSQWRVGRTNEELDIPVVFLKHFVRKPPPMSMPSKTYQLVVNNTKKKNLGVDKISHLQSRL